MAMGKSDKAQGKLQFELRKTPRSRDGAARGTNLAPEPPSSEMSSELWQMLTTMQQSLSLIDTKIDIFTLRMDKMTEHLDQQTERIDMMEQRVAEAEEDRSRWWTQAEKVIAALHAKTVDLEACSCRNNLRLVGLPESTHITNMDLY